MKSNDRYIEKDMDKLIGEYEPAVAVAKVEKILERRPKKVKNHGIVVTLSAKPSDKGDTHTTCNDTACKPQYLCSKFCKVTVKKSKLHNFFIIIYNLSIILHFYYNLLSKNILACILCENEMS